MIIINDCRFIKRGVDEGYDTKDYNYKYINRANNEVPRAPQTGKGPKENTRLVGGIRRSPINSSILSGGPAVSGTYGQPFLKLMRGIV